MKNVLLSFVVFFLVSSLIENSNAEEIMVNVEKIHQLSGCNDDSGIIEISVNGIHVNLDGYFIIVQPESKSFSSFELSGLKKGAHTIKVFSSTGEFITEKQGVDIEENSKCSNFAFKMWKEGGLPGVICLGATLLVIIVLLVYYNKVFAPREEEVRLKDEKRSKDRMRRHLHKYRKARGLKTEQLPSTKIIDECFLNNDKKGKGKGKRHEVEYALEAKAQQVEESIDIEDKDNTAKRKVVTLKRSLPVSKAARIFSDPCAIPADAIARVPVSKFTGVQTNDLIQFPGMSASIQNSLGYLYMGFQGVADNDESWRASFIKPVPVQQAEYKLQPVMSMQPSIVPSVKPDEIHFSTNATTNYTLDLGINPSEITVEENPYATLMQLEQSENKKIIQSMSHEKDLDQLECVYPELTSDSLTEDYREVEENTMGCSNDNFGEEIEEPDESKQMDSMETSPDTFAEMDVKAPEEPHIITAFDIQCEEQAKPEDIIEEQPQVLEEDEFALQDKPTVTFSEIPDDEPAAQVDEYSIGSEQTSGSESLLDNVDKEVAVGITNSAEAMLEDEQALSEDYQEPSIVEEAEIPTEHEEYEEAVPQYEQNDAVEPLPEMTDDHEISDEITEPAPPQPVAFEELDLQEQPLSENASYNDE